MDQRDKRIAIIAGVIVGVLGLGALLVAPRLQPSRAVVEARAGEHVERARRILDQYNAGLEQLGVLKRTQDGDKPDAGLSSDRVSLLLDQNPELLTDADKQLKELTGSWRNKPRPLGNGPTAVKAAQEGLKEQAAQIARHAKLLDDALDELKNGLAYSYGNTSGQDYLPAKMLEAAILYQQGAAAQREAVLLRGRAENPRIRLTDAAQEYTTLEKSKELADARDVKTRISNARQAAAEVKQRGDERAAKIATLDTQIAQLKSQIDERRARALEVRQQMEQMEEAGVDLARPGSFPGFASKFSELASTYAKNESEAAALESGTLTNADIDDSGDYVSGRYVPAGGEIHTERGLAGLRRDRTLAEAEWNGLKDALASAEAEVKAAEDLQRHLDAQVARDRERAQQIKESAGGLLKELKQATTEAEAAETRAIQKLNASIKAAETAAALASGAVGEAQTRAGELTSAKAQAAAPESVQKDDAWIAAQRGAQKADAQILLGKVYFQQFRDAARDYELFTAVSGPLGLDAASEASAAKCDEARKLGTDVLEVAIKQLETSWKALKEHWTVRAEIGGAMHLLSLFGDPDGVLRDTALANYQSAVEGREDNPTLQPYVQEYVARIRQLRR
ncbi:MAG TPA: hypothetical protein VGM03_10940 [Phycisphaerae bacterium]